MSRRKLSGYIRKTKVTVPERVGPHVRLVFSEMQRQNRTYDDMQDGSGVQRATVKAWRHKNRPSLESIEAALGFLGYDFVPVPRADVLPPEIVTRLRPIADDLGMSMPSAVRALVEVVTGIHSRIPVEAVGSTR